MSTVAGENFLELCKSVTIAPYATPKANRAIPLIATIYQGAGSFRVCFTGTWDGASFLISKSAILRTDESRDMSGVEGSVSLLASSERE